ncbi:MAG: hypothetical protein HOH06_05375 [Polaribacter sp.]|jgi:hypothetical protein|nr:hypothetical protein [Polaribacter sp.]MBT6082410.1 hypothetical protein [Polaribacter sp.]MBT7135276.1 hypothetical protein [Polaribacter sp.]
MPTTKQFQIQHFNNTLNLYASEEKQYTSSWFMDFGKFGSELINSERKKIYSINKKFKFWKWKMVYTIRDRSEDVLELISLNNRKTIYSIEVDQVIYVVKVHYKKKISVFKNGNKIAEFDASILDENQYHTTHLYLLDVNDLEMCFLLFSCLKIGETEQNSKIVLSSQKQLEINEEPWV